MTAPNRLRVYLAGPDVFFPNALRSGQRGVGDGRRGRMGESGELRESPG
jgi:hypothetical protein